MAKRTFYAYVAGEGEHADAVVTAVETRLDALVASRKWASKDVWVVNQHEPPHWDLGLNLAIPTGKAATASFLDDVVAVATELGALHRETGSRFVIGLHDAGSDETKDIETIASDAPNLDQLRASLKTALGLS